MWTNRGIKNMIKYGTGKRKRSLLWKIVFAGDGSVDDDC